MGNPIIRANKKFWHLNLKEIFDYRDLLVILAYRDFRIRYAQTFLGFLWAFIQPFLTLIIFILVFAKAVKVDTGNVPYPLFALSGMCAWTYFAFVMNQAGNSIIGASGIVQKIYFPRLIIPLSKAVVGLIDLVIVLMFFSVLMIIYQFTPPAQIILLPIFISLNIICSLAVGIWLSALTIRYRDFQVIIPFLVQFGIYATPIAYPVSLIESKFHGILFLNPMTGIVQGFRWCLIGGAPPNELSLLSYLMVILLFISGVFYFKKIERVMADIL